MENGPIGVLGVNAVINVHQVLNIVSVLVQILLQVNLGCLVMGTLGYQRTN